MIQAIIRFWHTLKARFRGWIEARLQHSHDHFLSYLPKKTGFISSGLLKLFYSRIKTDPSQLGCLNRLHQDGILVYIIKYRSPFEFLFAYTHYQQKKVPAPELALGYRFFMWQPFSRLWRILLAHIDHLIVKRALLDPFENGYYQRELLNGRAALLHLIERKGFYQRFVKEKKDPFQFLVQMQQAVEKPIYLIPQLFFFDRYPHRAAPSLIDIFFGTRENPGRTRRVVTLIRKPGKVFVEMSEPLNLKQYLQEPENRSQPLEALALDLRRRLLQKINRHRQSITGPLLKSSVELKENILTSNRLQDYMKSYAAKRNTPIQQVQKKADEYIDEIAAKFSVALVKFGALTVRWFMKTMFEGISVNTEMFSRIKLMAQKGPLIFVPCHKSHIDYLLISYILLQNNMPAPHIAAGKNLSFWPMGPLFRRGGAFFLRRSFKGAVLYSRVFAEYIRRLLQEGYNIECFIEGGRSRTGKPNLPKLGFISILIEAYKNKACEDMFFVPIYIGYDRVLEEKAYLHEIEGGKKNAESLGQLLKARKFLKKRYGRIYLNFHEPLSLNRLLSGLGKPLDALSTKEQHDFCRNIGFRLINAIDAVTVVTPHSLVASGVLNSFQNKFSLNYLTEILEAYLSYLTSQKIQLADTLRLDHHLAIEHAVDEFVQRKILERIPKDKEDQTSEEMYTVDADQRPILEYYKNNAIGYFVPAAFTALAILIRDSFQFTAVELRESYKFLQNLFKNEFAYDVDKPSEYFIRKSLKAFIDSTLLVPHPTLPDTYTVTPAGLRKLKYFSSFLKTYFESYWIVLNFFTRNSSNSNHRKTRLKKIQALGNRMYKRGEIGQHEALSNINFDNAADYFTSQGIKGTENKAKIDFFTETIQKYIYHLSA